MTRDQKNNFVSKRYNKIWVIMIWFYFIQNLHFFFYHIEYSDYCYIYALANMSFGFLQVFHVKLGSPHRISTKPFLRIEPATSWWFHFKALLNQFNFFYKEIVRVYLFLHCYIIQLYILMLKIAAKNWFISDEWSIMACF